MKDSRKEFILKAHEMACSEWKQNIEQEFPKLFNNNLEVGKWYKSGSELACITDLQKNLGCGFNCAGMFLDNINWGFKDTYLNWLPATEKEVENALVREANRRGYKEGSFKGLRHDSKGTGKGFYLNINNQLWTNTNGGSCMFEEGKWATIKKQSLKKKQKNN